LRARKVRNQVKEVKVKLIVYNINKKVIQLLWIKLRISTEPKKL
ncbi:MAG: IS5/IS1182 family transposase, partial [Methanosarcina flavescens]